MLPSYQHLDFQSSDSLVHCYWVKVPRFDFHWHYHQEYEITYLVKGKGTRLVGDSVAEFGPGDFVFLGSNLPHTWISEKELVGDDHSMEVVVLQFPESIFESSLGGAAELRNIQKLFRESHRGLHFEGAEMEPIKEDLIRMTELDGFEKFHLLLQLLDRLGATPSESLSSEFYIPNLNSESEGRVGKVCTYIQNHFATRLEVKQLADLVGMNDTAFCRFFKKMTGRTVVNYINDLRVSKACELLQKNDERIGDISFKVGFQSVTHFNRSFLRRKSITPSEFRRQFTRDAHGAE